MKLTISDWIAIIAAITQIVSMWGAVVWQVKKTLPAPMPADKKPIDLKASNSSAFIRKYWQSWLSIAIGIIGLLALFSRNEPVTKFFVAASIFLSLMCFLHLVVILFFEFMHRFTDKVVDVFFFTHYGDK